MITTSTQAPKAMPLAPAGPPPAAPQPPAPKAPAFSGGKPVAMPFSKEDPRRQQKLLIAGIGGGALVVALTLLFVFRPWKRAEPPRLTAEPAKLGALAATPDFQKMPFEKREVYMKMMDAKKSQIIQAHASGQMSDDEYQKALQAAQLGKRLDEMNKYFARPPGAARTAYLDKIVNKKETKQQTAKHDAALKEQEKEENIWRSKTEEDAEIATWPPEVQTKYNQFREAYQERKKLYKEAHPKEKKPTTATAPTAKNGG
jgi:hypothetical protein